jgi:hypothetical protein
MKKALVRLNFVFLLLFLLISFAKAQTFHAIIFAATADDKIGRSVEQDYYRMNAEFSAITEAIGMKLALNINTDDDFSISNLRRVLNNLQCSSKDIVFFYYTGHGGRANTDNSKFPQLAVCYEGCGDNDFMSLQKIDDLIRAKNPKFRIVMSDACNSFVQGLSSKQLSGSVTELKGDQVKNYKSLFLNISGGIIATSSSIGETSAATASGGAFTVCFLDEMQNAIMGSSPSWNTILEKAKTATYNLRQHTPVFEVNITNSSPTVPTANNSPATNNDLINTLIKIADVNQPQDTRFSMVSSALSTYFSSSIAKVQIVGQNGTTVVKTETADKFLRRLSTAFHLVNFAELSSVKDSNGKITEVKIHEIYKF